MSNADLKRPVFMQKLIDILSSPMIVGLLVTFTMTWLALQYYESQHDPSSIDEGSTIGILDQIHRKTIDFRLINRGEFAGSPRVAVLAIDDASIEREGRWPWPREKIGRLIENAVDAGAKIVAFDVVFSEPDPNSSGKSLRAIQQDLRKLTNADKKTIEQFQGMLSEKINQSNSDRTLADTVDLYSDNVVMGSYFDIESFGVNEVPNPLRDYCVDAHYGRYFEKKYWEQKSKKNNSTTEAKADSNKKGFVFGEINAVDPIILEKKAPPSELISSLAYYHDAIDSGAVSDWVSANPTSATKVSEALREFDVEFEVDKIPHVIFSSVVGDMDTIHALLESSSTLNKYANVFMMNQIVDTVNHTLNQSEAAEIRSFTLKAMNDYCRRYLTADDELLDIKKFAAATSQNPEDVEVDSWNTVSTEHVWNKYQIANKISPALPIEAAIALWNQNAFKNAVHSYERAWISTSEIARKTKYTGFFNANLDPDGTVRQSMLIARRGNHYIPSLALQTFLLDRKYNADFELEIDTRKERFTEKQSKRKVVRRFSILQQDGKKVFDVPVDETGRMQINYSGPQQMFPYISAHSLLSNSDTVTITYHSRDQKTGKVGLRTAKPNKKEFLKDKILIVGATAIGVYDLRLSPFEENYPGVETHANVLSNLLTEDSRARGEQISADQPGFLKIHPLEDQYMWILIAVGGIAVAAGLTWLGSVYGLLLTIGLLFSIYFLDRYVLLATSSTFRFQRSLCF